MRNRTSHEAINRVVPAKPVALTADICATRGKKCALQGDHATAIKLFSEAILRAPKTEWVAWRAMAYLCSGSTLNAAADSHQVFQSDPENRFARIVKAVTMGYCFSEKAVEILDGLLTGGPTDQFIYVCKIVVLHGVPGRAQTRRLMTRLLLHPENDVYLAIEALCQIHPLMGYGRQPDTEQAATLCATRALSINPDNAIAKYVLSQLGVTTCGEQPSIPDLSWFPNLLKLPLKLLDPTLVHSEAL